MEDETLIELKKRYKRIYSVEIKNVEYVFRALTFKEFDEIANIYDSESDSAEAEDVIVSLCTVYPYNLNLDRIPAGIITTLAGEILQVSGFLPGDTFTKEVLYKKREEAKEFRKMMYAFIIAAMPSYKKHELDEFTYEELAELLALAEKVIEVRQAEVGVENSGLHLNFHGEEEEGPQEKPEFIEMKDEFGKVKVRADDPIAARLMSELR